MSDASAARRQANLAGLQAEDHVARVLQSDGWEILARRFREGGGELDLVVRQDNRLRVVEVKLREPHDDSGLESIDEVKLSRIDAATEAFLQRYEAPFDEVCLLVALVEPGPDGFRVTFLDDPA
ncbi:MAG: YraN family protein [Deltaproteobacteria bacterium]|nr:YraN family protein [Deltaproteobacteria bacterium]MBK9646038.1 YraN family protein [Deltaproteobacteria bacterium]